MYTRKIATTHDLRAAHSHELGANGLSTLIKFWRANSLRKIRIRTSLLLDLKVVLQPAHLRQSQAPIPSLSSLQAQQHTRSKQAKSITTF